MKRQRKARKKKKRRPEIRTRQTKVDRRGEKRLRLILIAVLLIVLFLDWAYQSYQCYNLAKKGEGTTGIVTRVVEYNDSRDIIEYEYFCNGKRYEGRSHIDGPYQVGDTVYIYYLPLKEHVSRMVDEVRSRNLFDNLKRITQRL